MISAGTYNIIVQEGDTGTLTFNFPASFSLVGFTAKAQVRDHVENIICEFSSALNNISIVGQNLSIAVANKDTEYKPGLYKYDLQLTGNNQVITVAKGSFEIQPTVTR